MPERESFAERLTQARAILALHGDAARAMPVAVVDQIAAASRDAAERLLGTTHRRLATAKPDGGWERGVWEKDEHPAAVGHLIAAMLGCTETCPHLKIGAPVIARLPMRRLDCEVCAATMPLPPRIAAEDQCDYCDARPVHRFMPVVITLGPTMFVGDACHECGLALTGKGDPDMGAG
jgi:hypothetical protein